MELLVIDWAQWDDLMKYVQGDYDDFYADKLEDAYLGDLGMNFGAIFDSNNELVWGKAYLADGSIASLNTVFPDGIGRGSPLLSPENADQMVSGLINTAKGPAIISSAAILWSSAEGPAGGHVVLGELLNVGRMETISRTMLSVADVLPLEENRLPEHLTSVLNELIVDG